jgi:hypothetical protein
LILVFRDLSHKKNCLLDSTPQSFAFFAEKHTVIFQSKNFGETLAGRLEVSAPQEFRRSSQTVLLPVKRGQEHFASSSRLNISLAGPCFHTLSLLSPSIQTIKSIVDNAV